MFSGIGIWEVVLIIVVVLIVLGPQRVPEIARKLGQAMRYLRKASTDLTTAVTRELDTQQGKPPSHSPPTSNQPPQEEKPKSPSPTRRKTGTDSEESRPGTTREA